MPDSIGQQKAEQEWLRPELPAEHPSPDRLHQASDRSYYLPEHLQDPPQRPFGEEVPRRALFELRPLSLGELLDRVFSLYRSRFWLFASISAVSASVQVAVQAISLATMKGVMRAWVPAAQGGALSPPPLQLHDLLASQIAALAFLLVAAMTQAATTLAVSEVYLNRYASAKAALTVVLRRWGRWIGIALWQVGSLLWIPVVAAIPGFVLLGLGGRSGNSVLTVIGGGLVLLAVLGGLSGGFVLYLRNALAVPAAVAEGLTIRSAMRRSKNLAAGTKGRIFVVLLIALCLYWVVGMLESPLSMFLMFAPKQAEHYVLQTILLAVSFVGRTVVGPVAMIGLTLVYFDQRVRNEALDLELLLEEGRGGEPAGVGVLARKRSGDGFAPLG